MTSPPDNPYQAPATSSASGGASKTKGARTFFVAALLLTAAVLLVVVATRWQIIQVFEDFGVALPVLTRWALDPGFVVLLLVIIAGCVAKEYSVASRRNKLIGNLITSLAAVLLGATYAVAVIQQYFMLIYGLS